MSTPRFATNTRANRKITDTVALLPSVSSAGGARAEEGPYLGPDTKGLTALIGAILFTPDGSELISASDDKTIRVRDVEPGASCARLVGLGRAVWSVAFSPDEVPTSRMIASSRHRSCQLMSRAKCAS